MYLIRRSLVRAACSPSTTLLAKSRTFTINTTTLLRPVIHNIFTQPSVRRFESNEANDRRVESADDESSVVKSAIESASELASNAAGSVSHILSPEEPRGIHPYSPHEVQPSSGIYVGNLLFDITAEDLRREFGVYGPIESTTIAADARGLSKGFGYVQFSDIETAKKAIDARHQTILEGRRLVVNFMAKQTRDAGQKNPPGKTLFIGNLAFEMSDADLNKLFREIRNVVDVRVAIDRRTGQPRGFAHADFVDVESAVKAMEALQGREVYGRPLRVDYSGASKDRRPSLSGRS